MSIISASINVLTVDTEDDNLEPKQATLDFNYPDKLSTYNTVEINDTPQSVIIPDSFKSNTIEIDTQKSLPIPVKNYSTSAIKLTEETSVKVDSKPSINLKFNSNVDESNFFKIANLFSEIGTSKDKAIALENLGVDFKIATTLLSYYDKLDINSLITTIYDTILSKIIDNLNSDSNINFLSAKQGKVLNEKIISIQLLVKNNSSQLNDNTNNIRTNKANIESNKNDISNLNTSLSLLDSKIDNLKLELQEDINNKTQVIPSIQNDITNITNNLNDFKETETLHFDNYLLVREYWKTNKDYFYLGKIISIGNDAYLIYYLPAESLDLANDLSRYFKKVLIGNLDFETNTPYFTIDDNGDLNMTVISSDYPCSFILDDGVLYATV